MENAEKRYRLISIITQLQVQKEKTTYRKMGEGQEEAVHRTGAAEYPMTGALTALSCPLTQFCSNGRG